MSHPAAKDLAALQRRIDATLTLEPLGHKRASLAHRPAADVTLSAAEVGRFIDHTQLKPQTTPADIVQLCAEAREHNLWSVCVNAQWVALAVSLLPTTTRVCAVVGFPLGATLSSIKAAETRAVVAAGAQEVDMVLAIGSLKAGQWQAVAEDIRAVVEASGPALVKVILETSMLTDEEKVIACYLADLAGADYVKTSTGFGGGGATVEDVRLMREATHPEIGVKASGGVRTLDDARAMIAAGADRLGCSASVAIVTAASPGGDPGAY